MIGAAVNHLGRIDAELELIEEYEAGSGSALPAYLAAIWRVDWEREKDLIMKAGATKEVMKIEFWSVDKPVPYASNARKIPQAAIDKVAASIREFGWQQPIIVDPECVVVAGHVRLLAAKKLGETNIPVHVATGLTAGQLMALRLMDNRSHEETGWDLELLDAEIAELQALNVDILLTGFDAAEISKLLDSKADPLVSLTNPDETVPTVHQCPKCGYVPGAERLL